MGETHVFRTPMAQIMTIAIAAVAVVAMAYFVMVDGARELWRSGPVVLLIVVIVWLVFWRPRVVVSDGGITVANIARTVHVPWPLFTAVDSQWSLAVTAGGHKISSWAIPASSGMAARTRRPSRAETVRTWPEAGRFAPHARSANADTVAMTIAQRHQDLRGAGHLDQPTVGALAVTTTWNSTELLVLAGAVVLAALSLLTG